MDEATKKPTFLGQALLILLPVLVLLLVGLTSLRQDKILAHREAAQGARRLADVVLSESAATIESTREDRGSGIPVEEHENIFERFYRLGSELRHETEGVGIGLSIVKHIVEGHGGRVLLRSAPGQGSRFTIEL